MRAIDGSGGPVPNIPVCTAKLPPTELARYSRIRGRESLLIGEGFFDDDPWNQYATIGHELTHLWQNNNMGFIHLPLVRTILSRIAGAGLECCPIFCVASRTDPCGRSESSTYDLRGNPASATDRKGQVTSRSYEALDRLAAGDQTPTARATGSRR